MFFQSGVSNNSLFIIQYNMLGEEIKVQGNHNN